MDKDELFKSMKLLSAFAFKDILSNLQWNEQIAFCSDEAYTSQSTKKDIDKPKTKKENKNVNILKHFHNIIDSHYLEEKFKRENEENQIESANKYITNINNTKNDYYERKIHIYEKILARYAENKAKGNKLTFAYNSLLEKNALLSLSIFDSFPGMKPNSNWPICLDDLIRKLNNVKIEEVFLHPYDENSKKNFATEAIEAIERFALNCDFQNAKKGIFALISIAILIGDVVLLIDVLNKIDKIISKSDSQQIFNANINSDKQDEMNAEEMLNDKIKQLYVMANENNYTPYPIMRNNSIIDYFNISKAILYDQPFPKSISICSDGTYIYAIVNGLDGCKMKIGSGYNGTDRGRVYLSKPVKNDAVYHWVYCKGKIYMKAQWQTIYGYNSSSSPVKTQNANERELGFLYVISPETLEVEGNVKLLLPSKATHCSVIKKNEKYVLLSDGEKLSVIMLEPVIESEHLLREDNKISYDEHNIEEDIIPDIDFIQQLDSTLIQSGEKKFSYVTLELISYNTSNDLYDEKTIDKEKQSLIDELYESFSGLFSKEECYKALMWNKWNMESTAIYLVENPNQIKETLLFGDDPVQLFQTKIEEVSTANKAMRMDLKAIENPYFNVLQFDNVNWSITSEFVIGHSVRECAIFSRKSENVKEYEYVIVNEKDNIELLYRNFIQSQNKDAKNIKNVQEKAKDTSNTKAKREINDKIIGTLLKTANSISFGNNDIVITYDNIQKVYFVLTKGTLASLSICVIDTFIPYAKSMQNLFKIDYDELNSYFVNGIKFIDDKFNFNLFARKLTELALVMSSAKKCESYWRYKNWNFYFNSLIEYAKLNIYEDSIFAKKSSQSLLTGNRSEISKKALNNKIEKLANINKENLLKFLPKEFRELYKCKEIAPIYSSGNTTANDNWGNWLNKSRLMFKRVKQKKKQNIQNNNDEIINSVKDKMLYIDNKIYHYFSFCGEISEIEYLVDLLSCDSFSYFVSYDTIFAFIYLWMQNANDALFLTDNLHIESILSKLSNLLYDIYNSDKSEMNIKSKIILIVIEGWEILIRDINSQIKWIKLFFAFEQSDANNSNIILSPNIEYNIATLFATKPFSIILQKSDLTRNSVCIINNFNKTNVIKAYKLYPIKYKNENRLIAICNFFSLSPKNIQTPLHWALFGFSPLKIKFPRINEDAILEYEEESKVEQFPARKGQTVNKKVIGLHALIGKVPIAKNIELYINDDVNVNEDLWNFLSESCYDKKIIDFLSDLFALCIGDMNLIFKEKVELIINGNNNASGDTIANYSNNNINTKKKNKAENVIKLFSGVECDYYHKYFDFIVKANKYISDIIIKHPSINAIYLYRNFLYSLFAKIKSSPINTLSSLNDIFTKAISNINSIINKQSNSIRIMNDNVFQYESEKTFEFVIASGEAACIDKKVNMNSDIIAVEIDFKQTKIGASSADLLFVSEENPYANMGTYSNNNNNINKFGTSFQMKLTTPVNTTIFLKGKEIKINSVNKLSTLKTANNNIHGKSFLKIRCFPYNNQFFEVNNNKELNSNLLCQCVSLLNDVEYFTANIYKNLIKSFSLANNDIIKKYSIMRLGLKNNSFANELLNEYKSKMVFNIKNYDVCGIFAKANSNTMLINEIDIDKDYGYLNVALKKIRDKVKEPIAYSNIKMLPSFNANAKLKWNKIELMILLCILYHINIDNDFKVAIEKDNIVVIEPFFDLLGKKINLVIGKMANKAKVIKDFYDSVRINIDDYIEEYTIMYNELKDDIIRECLVKKDIEDKKEKNEESKEDKKKKKEEKKKKKLESMFISKKEPNYKKKKNAKRLYTEMPSSSHNKHHIENIVESKVDEQKEKEIDYHSMTLSEIINITTGKLNEKQNEKLSSLKFLINKFHTKIESECHSQFFGEAEKLRILCEAKSIEYNESNPSETIKQYANHIYETFTSFITKESNSYEINAKAINESLSQISPFITVYTSMHQKLLFLLSLNHFDASSGSVDIPFIDRLPSTNRENSLSHSVHSSIRSKSKKGDDDDNYLFDKTQQMILRSIMNFIMKPISNVDECVRILTRQYITSQIRSIGINLLSKSVDISRKTSLLNGIISDAVCEDINYAIESAKIANKESELYNLLVYYMKAYIENCEVLIKEKQSEDNKIVLNTIQGHVSFALNEEEKKLIANKNLLFTICDINLILKHITSSKAKNEIEFDYANVSNFVEIGIENIFAKNEANKKISSLYNSLFISVLCKLMSISSLQKTICELIFSKFALKLDAFISANKEDQIANILEMMQSMITTSQESKSLSKIASKLIELIDASETYAVVKSSVCLIKNFPKIISSKTLDLNRIFAKIGKIFLIKNEYTSHNDDILYNVIIHMNSTEIDYQHLVNALFYWENKYPTTLSKDANDQNIPLHIEELATHKVKMFAYFNTAKTKANKMFALNKIVDERISNVKKAIDEANKLLSKDKKNEENKAKLAQLKKNEKYLTRIKTHISLATEIGEIASIRGYCVLSPPFPISKAKELADLIAKSSCKYLPHIPSSLDKESKPLFNDDLIYPSMTLKNNLEPGCMNTLKETTKDFLTVSLMEESALRALKLNMSTFEENAKRNAIYEDKKAKISTYNRNFLFGFAKKTILMSSYNDNKAIIDNEAKSGKSLVMIIECVVEMLYEISKRNEAMMIKQMRIKMQNIKNEWKNDINAKYWILGMLIYIGDFYKTLRKNSKAIFNKKECIVVNGGDKSGNAFCDVLFNSDDQNVKIEKIRLENLTKYEHNTLLIKNISLKEIIENVIFAYDELLADKESMSNKLLLHLLLKILNAKKIETNELLNYMNKENETFTKFHSILTKISSKTIWLEKEDQFWEAEFIDSFERIYNKIDSNSNIIFSPMFNIAPSNIAISPLPKLPTSTDVISNYNLPETNYVKQLPKLSDLSKVNTALKNIQIFDRYIVGEIFAYCKKQYTANDYFSSLAQIRNHLSNGDIENTMIDLRSIFDNNSMPTNIPLPREQYDSKEIMKEEIYPGNYYLAKISHKFLNSCDIHCLKKLSSIGVNEVPVLVLIQDNAINHALVMINDEESGRMISFWVNSDHLMFLDRQIKLPASAFEFDALMGEYMYLEKRLKVLYAKNALSNIMMILATKQKINNFDNLIDFVILNNWKGYKLSPTSGVFHSFKNFITIQKNDKIKSVLHKINSSSKNNNNTTTFEDVLSSLSQTTSNSDDQMIQNSEINLNKIFSGLTINNSSALSMVIKWCISNWSNLASSFQIISTNLFKEYTRNISFNAQTTLTSKEMFHMGNFSNKLLTLHELFGDTSSTQHCGIILTFTEKANLGPHAKLTFYSDPYGESVIHEIDSFKTLTSNLESCVFNYPKIWMNYTPGTRAFYSFDWDLQTRDSDLPCTITLIPYHWSPLVQLTDYCTSALFNNLDIKEINVFKDIIKVLLDNCITMNLPAEIQRRIFTLTNRAILKCSKFIALLIKENELNYNKMQIGEKFEFLGIKEENLISLIQKVNTFSSSQGEDDMKLSSAYVVEGVEIILSILSVIGESYSVLESYLKDKFKYELPIWIEAIIKLGQLLNYMQGTSMLDEKMKNEIFEQNKIKDEFNNIIIIKYKSEKEISADKIKEIISENCGCVVDGKNDIIINKDEGYIGILLDGFVLDGRMSKEEEERKKKEEEEKRKKEEAEELWTCFYCKNENAQENEECLFCFKLKKVLPKEKPKPKPQKGRKMSIIDEGSMKTAVANKMTILITQIKKYLETIVSYQEVIQGNCITNEQNSPLLNKFLSQRLQLYIKEGDYFNEKIRILKTLPHLSSDVKSQIEKFLSDSNNTSVLSLHQMLHSNSIDLWFENVSLNSAEIPINISLMEKIREEIDLKISKSGPYSATLPSSSLRVIPLSFSTINHQHLLSLQSIPLHILRYYWTIIKYFNNCLVEALPFIKPPDYYMTSTSQTEEGFLSIPFPRTISAFLSSARGIMFSYIKNGLIKEVLNATEYTEEEVQIPTFKFERLSIANSFEKKNAIISSQLNNNDDDINNNVEYKKEDSMFLQAYEQFREVDVAFFRSKKNPGDPHVGFKVEFKNELVQGLGGPYRQFFSDISNELNQFLPLLIPTANNIAQKGDYKDRFTLSPSYNSSTALYHFEFLGVLMGICIRTGVHLTLDLASLIWKKIIDEQITSDDVYQYDEGLYNMIKALTDKDLTVDEFNNNFNCSFSTELTDHTIKDLVPEGGNIKVNYTERLKFANLLASTRLNECDMQIASLRKGLGKIIPISLLKLMTYKELEQLVCGAKTFDVSLLRQNTNLSPDLTENSNKVRWLWEIIEEMSDEDKVKFIKFCWAQERLPATNEEFQKNQIRFTIKSHTDKNKKNIFPRADTCFFNLELPEYTSKEIMKNKIIQAINLDNVGMNADKVSRDVLNSHLNNANANRNQFEDDDEYDYDSM